MRPPAPGCTNAMEGPALADPGASGACSSTERIRAALAQMAAAGMARVNAIERLRREIVTVADMGAPPSRFAGHHACHTHDTRPAHQGDTRLLRQRWMRAPAH